MNGPQRACSELALARTSSCRRFQDVQTSARHTPRRCADASRNRPHREDDEDEDEDEDDTKRYTASPPTAPHSREPKRTLAHRAAAPSVRAAATARTARRMAGVAIGRAATQRCDVIRQAGTRAIACRNRQVKPQMRSSSVVRRAIVECVWVNAGRPTLALPLHRMHVMTRRSRWHPI